MADDDRKSEPGTAPFVPDFDTGTHSQPFLPVAGERQKLGKSGAETSPQELKEEPANPSATTAPVEDSATANVPAPESAATPAQSVTVPGRYYYLKWWKLVLVILGVWIAAAEVGLSLYYWWYHTIDKTPAVFVVLVYIVVCTVAGLMLAMVQGRPLISALALAVMSAPFASVAAAAPLYGFYYCARMSHCLVGVIPY